MIQPPQGEWATVAGLRKMASTVRQRDLQTVFGARLGHIGGEMSATDILVTLYFAVLRVDPARPDDPDRNKVPGVAGLLGHVAAEGIEARVLKGICAAALDLFGAKVAR